MSSQTIADRSDHLSGSPKRTVDLGQGLDSVFVARLEEECRRDVGREIQRQIAMSGSPTGHMCRESAISIFRTSFLERLARARSTLGSHDKTKPILQIPHAEVQLTDRCQMKCIFCANGGDWIHEDSPYGRSMSSGFLRDIFLRTQIKNLVLTGGEPSLEPVLLQAAIESAKDSGTERITMNTNLEILEIADYVRLQTLGLSGVHFAVNALDPQKHRKLRGVTDANLDKLRENILNILEQTRLRLTPEFVCMRPNLRYFWDVYALLNELHGKFPGRFSSLEFQKLICVGRGNDKLAPEIGEISNMLGSARIKEGDLVVRAFCFGPDSVRFAQFGINERCCSVVAPHIRITVDGRVSTSNFTNIPIAESIFDLDQKKLNAFFHTFVCPLSPPRYP